MYSDYSGDAAYGFMSLLYGVQGGMPDFIPREEAEWRHLLF